MKSLRAIVIIAIGGLLIYLLDKGRAVDIATIAVVGVVTLLVVGYAISYRRKINASKMRSIGVDYASLLETGDFLYCYPDKECLIKNTLCAIDGDVIRLYNVPAYFLFDIGLAMPDEMGLEEVPLKAVKNIYLNDYTGYKVSSVYRGPHFSPEKVGERYARSKYERVQLVIEWIDHEGGSQYWAFKKEGGGALKAMTTIKNRLYAQLRNIKC